MKDQRPFGEWLPEAIERMENERSQREQYENSLLGRVGKVLKISWVWIFGALFILWYLYNGGAAAYFG